MPDASNEQRAIARALLSVSDKRGIVDFARALAAHGVALVSTGGTHKVLVEAGLDVAEVADLTGFPEMMDGRVKTLHPKVHGGLLAIRGNPEHEAAMLAHDIRAIDLLVVNLYPFEAAVARGADFETCVENIDIGGPAMIRGAAKNHADVAVVVDPADYSEVLAALAEGGTDLALRKRLAQKAYARTAVYDAAISNWMAGAIGEPAPKWRAVGGTLIEALALRREPAPAGCVLRRCGGAAGRRHGAPRCRARRSRTTTSTTPMPRSSSSPSSRPRPGPAVAIIKHANPCGVARGPSLVAAYELALRCDPVSAFGGIVALNGRLDAAAAREIVKIFTEVIVAPEADDEAIAIVSAKPNLRLLLTGTLPDPRAPGLTIRPVGRRLFGAGPRRRGRGRSRSTCRHQARPERSGDGRPAVRVFGCETRQIQRHRLREGWRDRGDRGGTDEPHRLVPHGGDEGRRGGAGSQAAPIAR